MLHKRRLRRETASRRVISASGDDGRVEREETEAVVTALRNIFLPRLLDRDASILLTLLADIWPEAEVPRGLGAGKSATASLKSGSGSSTDSRTDKMRSKISSNQRPRSFRGQIRRSYRSMRLLTGFAIMVFNCLSFIVYPTVNINRYWFDIRYKGVICKSSCHVAVRSLLWNWISFLLCVNFSVFCCSVSICIVDGSICIKCQLYYF